MSIASRGAFMDSHIILILLINIVISILLITSLRFIKGRSYGVNSIEELSVRDNFAFGLSLGGEVVGLSLVMMGVMSGGSAYTFLGEFVSVLGYGILGLILIKAGGFFQDRVVIPRLPIHSEIGQGNVAAAVFDMAHLIATGLIIRAVMVWVDASSLRGMVLIVVAFVAAQLVMLLVSFYRRFVYKRNNNGAELEHAIKQKHLALSIRYAGHIIGAALAVSSVSGIVVFDAVQFKSSILTWFISSVVMVVVLSLFALLARLVILKGINVVEEVDQQRNIGVASIEAAIYIAIGLIFIGGLS